MAVIDNVRNRFVDFVNLIGESTINYINWVEDSTNRFALRIILAESRQIDYFFNNEQTLGKNTTLFLVYLLHATWFIAYQALFMSMLGALVIPLTILCAPIFALLFGVGVLEAIAFASYMLYREALKMALDYTIRIFNALLNIYLANQLVPIDGVDDVVPQNRTIIGNILANTAKFINYIIGLPGQIIKHLDSKVADFLLSKKTSWGKDRVKTLHSIYTWAMFGIRFALMLVPNIFLGIFIFNKGAKWLNISIPARYTAFRNLPWRVLLLAHLPINIGMGLGVALFSILEVYADSMQKVFNARVNQTTAQSNTNRLQENVTRLMQAQDYPAVLQLYKDNAPYMHAESVGLINFWPELFVMAHRANIRYLQGISNASLEALEEDPAVKTCFITRVVCENPVYVEIAGVRTYYDLFPLLRWLSNSNKNPRSNTAITLDDIKFDLAAKELIDRKIQAARNNPVETNSAPWPGLVPYFRSIWNGNTGQQPTPAPSDLENQMQTPMQAGGLRAAA